MHFEIDIQRLNEQELLTGYRKTGEKVYPGELFKRYTKFVFFICMKYLQSEQQSEDASMEVFEKLLSELKHVEIKNFRPWLYTVTKNHCLMILRSQRKTEDFEETVLKHPEQLMKTDALLHPDQTNNNELKLQQLENAINKLNEEQKICVELFYLKERSYKEVVGLTGFSMKEVKSYIQNGKRNLKKLLTEDRVIIMLLCIHFIIE